MKNKWKIAGIAMLGVVIVAFCIWSLLSCPRAVPPESC